MLSDDKIPQCGVPRHTKTAKKVSIFHGNFVLDLAVPNKLLDMCPKKSEREFAYLRYSAATGDPDDFKDLGFTLRQCHYDPPRRTELFILITMRDEDPEMLCATIQATFQNIAHLCQRSRSRTWGGEAWKNVVVCIVNDGRSNIHPSTLDVLSLLGCYQSGIEKPMINNKAVTAHLYEYTTQSVFSPEFCTSLTLF